MKAGAEALTLEVSTTRERQKGQVFKGLARFGGQVLGKLLDPKYSKTTCKPFPELGGLWVMEHISGSGFSTAAHLGMLGLRQYPNQWLLGSMQESQKVLENFCLS